jgi:hypothetical protein
LDADVSTVEGGTPVFAAQNPASRELVVAAV